jgi:hypothetical protein
VQLFLRKATLQQMRALRIAPLIIAVLLTTLFAISYTKTVGSLLPGLETGGASFPRDCYNLRNDINVIVWKAWPQFKSWAHDGSSLIHYGDAPEGTRAVVYFPSWYLLIPLAAFWGFAILVLSKHSKHQRPITATKPN